MRKTFIFASIATLLWPISSANASFTIDNSLPGDPNFGNARTAEFDKAIRGNSELTAQERAYLAKHTFTPVTNVWYAKSKLSLSNYEVDSVSAGATNTVAVTSTGRDSTGLGYEFGIGYKWNAWRTELELLVTNDITYAPGVSATIDYESYALLWNIIRDFSPIFKLHPYIGIGIGAALNSADGTFAIGTPATRSDDNLDFAYNAFAGVRFRVTNHLWLDLSYRYADLGSAEVGPATVGGGIVDLAGDVTFTGFSFGFNWQF